MPLSSVLGQIIPFASDVELKDYLPCDGQSLAVVANQALFTLIEFNYGGSSINFRLPDLRSRIAAGVSPQQPLGLSVGSSEVILTPSELPAHSHAIRVFSGASNTFLVNQTHLSSSAGSACYSTAQPNAIMSAQSLGRAPEGENGLAHDNLQPYLSLSYRICINGHYPTSGGTTPGEIGEIMLLAHSVYGTNWMPCDGRVLQIAQYTSLFALVGTQFGGDGMVTFALPDLRGRTPVAHGQGPQLSSRNVGEKGGLQAVALTIPEMPAHTHPFRVADATPLAGEDTPGGRNFCAGAHFSSSAADGTLNLTVTAIEGGGLGHSNLQPTLYLQFVICVAGTFPYLN